MSEIIDTKNIKTPEQLLSKFREPLLKGLMSGIGKKTTKNSTVDSMSSDILDFALHKGVELFVKALDKGTLQTATGELKIKVEDKKLAEEFQKKIDEEKELDKFFDNFGQSTLAKFAKCLELEGLEKAKKSELKEEILDEITIIGLKKVFDTMKKDFFVEVAKDFGISTAGASKKKLVGSILGIVFPKEAEKIQEAEKENEKPKEPIKKGLNADQLFKNYLYKDLADFVREHNLNPKGTKKVLANRIEKFLEGKAGPKDMKPEPKEKKKSDKKKKKKVSRSKRNMI